MIRVQFNKDGVVEGQPNAIDLDGDTIAFNQVGCIVVMKGKDDVVGMFPGGMVAGVYMPDGPNVIKPATGVLVK